MIGFSSTSRIHSQIRLSKYGDTHVNVLFVRELEFTMQNLQRVGTAKFDILKVHNVS